MTVLQKEIRTDIAQKVTNPTIQSLYRSWESLCADGGLPSPSDMNPAKLDWCNRNLMLFRRIGDDDFEYLYYGLAISAISKFDMTGKRVSDFDSDVGEFFRKKYLECLDARHPIYTKHNGQHAVAVTSWERLLMPLESDNGEAYILAYNQPIELRHELLESVLDSSTNGIVFYRAERNAAEELISFEIATMNQAAEEIPISESGTLRDTHLSASTNELLFNRLRDAVESGDPQSFEFDAEFHGIVLSYRVNAAKTGDGVTVTFTDITELVRQALHARTLNVELVGKATALEKSITALQSEIAGRKQAENKLAVVAQELRRSNLELEDYAYRASHDLRGPLRGLKEVVTWITDDVGPKVDEVTLDYLNLMVRMTDRMDGLVTSLLDYARAGHVEHATSEVDCRDLAQELFAMVVGKRKFTLTQHGDLPTFLTARTPLEQVFRNLMENAIKHHDRDEGTIDIAVRDTNDFYEFTVSDDGPGVPIDHQDRVFEMFQTLRPKDDVEGSGMGLALVKKIIAAKGGEICIESTEGTRGTSFHFQWPKIWTASHGIKASLDPIQEINTQADGTFDAVPAQLAISSTQDQGIVRKGLQ
jgi:signal transduction histidine kinase